MCKTKNGSVPFQDFVIICELAVSAHAYGNMKVNLECHFPIGKLSNKQQTKKDIIRIRKQQLNDP